MLIGVTPISYKNNNGTLLKASRQGPDKIMFLNGHKNITLVILRGGKKVNATVIWPSAYQCCVHLYKIYVDPFVDPILNKQDLNWNI
jgi:hypothetical protein